MAGRIKTDICMIGAGSGGLSVAAGAIQMGAKVVIIEGHLMGGDCLNYGCVPSKALLAAGKHAHALREGPPFGVAEATPQVDYLAAMAHVRASIEAIAPVDSQERFEKLGCTVLRDWASFISNREVQAGDTVVEARRFVIATGSSPLIPPIPGLDDLPYLTNETLWDLQEKPDQLLIVGGGPIGIEMAQAHVRLGCKVTVIEGAKALGKDDPEASALVLKRLRAEGVEIVEGAQVEQVSGKPGAVAVETGAGRYEGTHLLLAVGRKVNLERLDLRRAGVKYGKVVEVDARLRTSNKRVYAIGDAAGGPQFTHVAGYHGGVVVRALCFGLPAKAGTAHIPWATYTDPELAQVGLTEAQARHEYGGRLEVARFDYAGNDRAVAERQTEGFIKVMVAGGRPVGATIVGAQAGDLVSLWSLAIANRLKMSAIAAMVAPYPTLGELNKRAAGAYFSPRLFENPAVKRVVGFVQRWLP
ncbi:NAD(P)/FAD-dependent oxidoreductase [Pseudoruegeria sp. HB172150]|uniref:dihydrolipoyl dehydrogenase family protein n=1 Tax=Pseudoruegeria sp. HB172150 TaxID=2721164 RepID=UPI001555D8E2|nr:FAD-dependent oxidoreductase [Pseudoruegeria sp. HB172150]